MRTSIQTRCTNGFEVISLRLNWMSDLWSGFGLRLRVHRIICMACVKNMQSYCRTTMSDVKMWLLFSLRQIRILIRSTHLDPSLFVWYWYPSDLAIHEYGNGVERFRYLQHHMLVGLNAEMVRSLSLLAVIRL